MKLADLFERDDAAVKRNGWDGNPDTRWAYDPPGEETSVSTNWTGLQVVEDILGKDLVTDDEHSVQPGMYYVYQSRRSSFYVVDGIGVVSLADPYSRQAVHVAVAAHEAYHAYIASKSKGQLYANEKTVNAMATKWLKKNLTGVALHVALERILHSKIYYGHN